MSTSPASVPHHHHVSWPVSRRTRVAIIAGALVVVLLNALGVVQAVFGIDTALVVALLGGYPLAARAISAIRARRITYDITIALAAGIAILVGQYLAAAEVVLIIMLGDALEHWAIHRADHAIASLLAVQPARASVIRDGREETVAAADVRLTDRVIVRGGERVPVDGVILDGHAAIDQSLITGESMVASKAPGAQVYGGSFVEHGAIDIRPERVGEDTTLARIGRLVSEAKRRQAPIVRTADRLSEKIFLPVLLVSAGAVYLMTGEALRSVAVLLVACSCALVYAAPAAFAVALARLAREGVLVKGGDVLEQLSRVAVVAFDKTGTLTLGRPSIGEVTAAAGFTQQEVIRLAAAAERRSEHAFGRAIVAEGERRRLDIPVAEGFSARPGLGIIATVDGREVRVGSLAFMRELNADVVPTLEELAAQTGRPVDSHIAVVVDHRPAGLLALHDAPRPGAATAIGALREAGVRKVLLLTGDDRRTALAIADEVGIHADDVHAGLLPEEKLRRLRESGTLEPGEKVLMVGDGVNDAPALAAADVGIAFGRGAADLSAEAAQVVLIEPRLTAIPELIAFARKTVTRVQFNILAFAIGVNVLAIVAAGLGYLTPAASAILHQVVSLFVILASVSLLFEGRAIGLARGWQDWDVAARRSLQAWRATYGVATVRWTKQHRRELVRSVVAVALLAWVSSGLIMLQPDETAVVQRFGRLVNGDVGPGLHIRLPWPLETVARLSPRRIRILDIGFRRPAVPLAGPIDLEWNTYHGGGQVQEVAGENLVLTGDENLSELYAVVHYSIADPARYLFAVRDSEALVRMMAEGTLRGIAASYSLDTLLTTDRQALEHRWREAMRAHLEAVNAGIDVIDIHLTDVHPPVEVVEAFRDVASSQEQQTTNINEAEAYSKEQIPIARGNAEAKLEEAKGYRASRISRSEGDAARFVARASQFGTSPVTMFRLQMEALEAVLPGKKVIIADDRKGSRRTWTFVGDDVGTLPPSLFLNALPRPLDDDESPPPVGVPK